MLKWNVDGMSKEKPGPLGIGGVLKDHDGEFIYIFSCFMGNMNSNDSKVLGIQKALFLSIDYYNASYHQWIMKLDSYTVISWIKKNNNIQLWHLEGIFNFIFNTCNHHFFVDFKKCS